MFTLGLATLRLSIAGRNFQFDSSESVRRDLDKLDPDTNSSQAIAHLATSADFNTRLGKTKLEVKDRALGEVPARIDEHSLSADVGRAGSDVLAITLVGDRKVA